MGKIWSCVNSVCPRSLSLSLSLSLPPSLPFTSYITLSTPPPTSVSHSRMLPPLNKEFPKNHSSSPPSAIGQLCFHSNRLKDLNPPAHTESVVAGAFQGRLNLLVFDVAMVQQMQVKLNQWAHVTIIHPKRCVHNATYWYNTSFW